MQRQPSSSSLSSAPSDIPEEGTPATVLTEATVENIASEKTAFSSTIRKRKAAQESASVKRTKRAATGAQPKYSGHTETTEVKEEVEGTPKRIRATRGGRVANGAPAVKVEVKTEREEEVEAELDDGEAAKPKKRVRTKAKKSVEEEIEVEKEEADGAEVKKTKRKRKTKEEKEAEMLPLAARTVGSKVVLGAHVSAAGGVHNAVTNSVHIGGNAFALFLKSQRKWANPPLNEEHIPLWNANCKDHKIECAKHVVPHGSYLVNLAHTDKERTNQAYDSFLDDLTRCHALGIKLYNFHPGNCASSDRDEAIKHLAANLNRAHKDPTTGTVITLLETMAAAGNTIGSTFRELAEIISHVDDKSRVGVCLDTCHVFAAGYDLRTPEAFRATLDAFDRDIGLAYLKALHVNDSKAPLGSHRDLHANIGTGFLGLRAFHNLVNEPRLWGLPMVLETPIEVKGPDGKAVEDKGIWAREIKMLEGLVGMDVESEEFMALEKELQERGRGERERVQDQVDRKREKDEKEKEKKKNAKARGGRKGKKVESESEGESEVD